MATELNQITFDFSDDGEPSRPEALPERAVPPRKEKPKSTRGRKSLKEAGEEADFVEVPEDEVLFQKQYYAIGEVAQMFHVNSSLLRFWEGEFGLQLRKNRKGDRFFTPQDIKTLQLIHDLVRRRKFTIEGAKEYMKRDRQAEERYAMIQSLQRLRTFLLELKAHL